MLRHISRDCATDVAEVLRCGMLAAFGHPAKHVRGGKCEEQCHSQAKHGDHQKSTAYLFRHQILYPGTLPRTQAAFHNSFTNRSGLRGTHGQQVFNARFSHQLAWRHTAHNSCPGWGSAVTRIIDCVSNSKKPLAATLDGVQF